MFVVALGKSRCAPFSFFAVWKTCGQGFDKGKSLGRMRGWGLGKGRRKPF
ncbi:hypothetical protein WCP94_001940 [Bilophila wadsworthia]